MLAKKMKKPLAMLLSLVMVLGMLPVSAFAVGNHSSEEQILKDSNKTQYFTYDNGAFDTTGSNSAAVTNRETDPEVTISKTIAGVADMENMFDVTLNVQTTQRVEKSPTMPDAAVALVIDKSTSMHACVECGAGSQSGEAPGRYGHKYACEYYEKWDYVSRIEAAQDAAIEFAGKYAESAKDETGKVIAHRYIALVKFSGSVETVDLDTSSNTVWIDVAALTWTKTANAAGEETYLTSQNSLVTAIRGVTPPYWGDGTNVTDALGNASTALNSLFTEQTGNVKLTRATSFVVLLGDGEPNKSGTAPTDNTGFKRYSNYSGDSYKNAEKWVYQIRKTGTKLLSAYVGTDENDKGYKWFQAFSNSCKLASSAKELVESFETYLTLITISADAWEVTDPMGDNISFVGKQIGENNFEVAGTPETLTWTLRNDVPTVYEKGTTTKVDIGDIEDNEAYDFVYSLTYRIKLNSFGTNAAAYGLTNGATYLTYYLLNADGEPVNEAGVKIEGVSDLPKLYFKVPKVKALDAQSLNFTKTDPQGSPIVGTVDKIAKFELTHTDNCGQTGFAAQENTSMGSNGEISFANLPSGHTYTLTETAPPSGFVKSGDTWEVTVAWGQLSVKKAGSPIADLKFPNTYDVAEQEVTVTKVWQDSTDSYKTKTVSFELIATVDGSNTLSKTDSMTINDATEEGGKTWTKTFQDLPTKDANTGKPIVYSVKETGENDNKIQLDSVNYTVAYDQNARKITNTIVGTRDITVTKAWVDVEGSAQGDVELTLTRSSTNNLRSGEAWSATGTIAQGATSYTFEDLDIYDELGMPYTYSVSEKKVPGYQNGEVVKGDDGNFTITNKLDQAYYGSISGEKTWVDYDNAYETRPESITVNLMKGTEKLASKTVSADTNWKYSFANDETIDGTVLSLPKYTFNADGSVSEIKYSIEEDTVEGYTPSYTGYNVQNTLTHQERINVGVSKEWIAPDDLAQPDSVTIQLLRNDVVLTDADKQPVTVTLNEANEWTAKFENLLKLDKAGAAYVYTVQELGVPTNYTAAVTGDQETGFIVTNTYQPTESDKITINATKQWIDVDDTQRATVTVAVLEDGAPLLDENDSPVTFEITKQADGSWSGSITLDKYKTVTTYETVTETGADGITAEKQVATTDIVECVYTLDEVTVPGYTKGVITGNMTTGFTIKNVLTQDNTVAVYVGKEWVDGLSTTKPDVTFYLTAKNNETGVYERVDAQTLVMQNGTITGSFTGLPKYDITENSVTVIDYNVEEGTLTTHTQTGKTGTGTEAEPFVFTNTLNASMTSVSGTKTWVDDDDANGTRPETITINLMRYVEGQDKSTATEQGEVILTKDQTSFTFGLAEDGVTPTLPNYSDDRTQAYVYFVTEDAVDNYTTSYNGNSITNTIESGSVTISGTKSWIAPAESESFQYPDVTIVITRDNVEFATIVLDGEVDENGETAAWTYSWTGDKYDTTDGHEYKYTVSEQAIEGYSRKAGETGPNFTNVIAQDATYSIGGVKVWEMKGSSVPKPEKLTLKLFADGVDTGRTADTTEVDGWAFAFIDLDRYDLSDNGDGHEIVYTVKEVDSKSTVIDDGCEAIFSSKKFTASYDYDLTKAPENTTYDLTKAPVDMPYDKFVTVTNTFKTRDEEGGNPIYAYQLKAVYTDKLDGVTVGEPQTVTLSDGRSYDTIDLPVLTAVYARPNDVARDYDFVAASTTMTIGGDPAEVPEYDTENGKYVFDINTENKEYVITLYYEDNSITPVVNYTVRHDYYLNGSLSTSAPGTGGSGKVGSTVSSASIAPVSTYGGSTYTFDGYDVETLTLDEDASKNVIVLRYSRTTSPDDIDTTIRYDLVVKYLEEGTEEELTSQYSTRTVEGSSYDMTSRTEKGISGYTIVSVTGDAVTGQMDGNKEIIVWYAPETTIPENPTPEGPKPTDPKPTDPKPSDSVDIPDTAVPEGPGEEIVITDEGTPMGNLPQTGTMTTAADPTRTQGYLAFAASMAAAGLAFVIGRKREDDEQA